MSSAAFPNYTQIPSRVPQPVWRAVRITSVTVALIVAVTLIVEPDTGLKIFWQIIIPALPLLFFVAPGLWRNSCPLAASNQTPRTLEFTRGLTAPDWFREYSYVFAITAFMVIVASRKVLFNDSGVATAALLLAALGAAFVGGYILKGKSGWCGSICPLLPIQRIYGQTPFVTVPNSHCRPCVGCTKNCYDFNPKVAYLADLNDDDRYFAGYRKFFAGAFPGVVLGYFTVADPPDISVAEMYLQFGLFVLGSVGSFALLDTFVKVSAQKLTALYGAAALNLFYWYGAPIFIEAVSGQEAPDWLVWPARAAVFALTALWVVRTYQKEKLFLLQAAAPPQVKLKAEALAEHRSSQEQDPEVTFMPEEDRVVAPVGVTLLEVAEGDGKKIEAGCRMGVCGADPVAVVDGMDNLSPVSDDERTTLERLGLAPNTRMACCARVTGNVSINLEPERPKRYTSSIIQGFNYNRDISKVVVVGNGIAGVTAADHVRRRHPLCEIDLVADETHHLYNRMGISRLIYGRSAMQGLYLLPERWYEDNVITTWLNTRAGSIDRDAKEIVLRTGERLSYDRLILAMGSSGTVPPVEGFGVEGTYVLRAADDALRIRAFSQQHGCERAVIGGGGLLGLEAGYALRQLGLRVTVLERSERLLRRQLDHRASHLLHLYLEGLGMEISLRSEAAALASNGRVRAVTLRNEEVIPADLYLACVGITPNVDLAREADLEVNRGIVVDDRMRTNDADIFAAGDVTEHRGQIYGLWPTAVEQAEVAADAAVGGERTYEGTIPITMLKVVGIELTSIGRFEPESDDEEVIALEEEHDQRYRKLVISPDGRIVGAILLGYSREATPIATVVKKGIDVTSRLPALRAGDWSVLNDLEGASPTVLAPATAGSG